MVKTLLKVVKKDCSEKKCEVKDKCEDDVYYELIDADDCKPKPRKYDPIEIHIHIPHFFSMMPWLYPYWKIA